MSNRLSNCLATRLNGVVERVMQDYSKYYSEEIKFTCAVSSISTGRTIVLAKIALFNAKDRLI